MSADALDYLHPRRQARGLLVLIGRGVLDLLGWIGQLSILFRDCSRTALHDRPRYQIFAAQFFHIGLLSLPIVLVTGASMGLVMAVQAHATLVRFNAEAMCGPMVMYSMVTQLGPSMSAILVAGRVGSNIAAEIGTMKVTEQIDALRVMGTDPVSYLVLPRVAALVLLLPMMAALADFAGVWAGAGLLVGLWGVDQGAYWHQTEKYLASWDVLMGLAKTPFLGLLIALVACRQGLQTGGGATGVGQSCTRAVVQGCATVLVVNFLITLLTNKLYHLLH
ncbi:MAG: ABC transporter permease [Planctomycetes bacterium]|nr:ABC transporter permease [Planctomycetota bacterium]